MPACFCKRMVQYCQAQKLSQLAEYLSLELLSTERYQGSMLRPGSLPRSFSFFNWNRSLLRIQEILEGLRTHMVTGTMIENQNQNQNQNCSDALLWTCPEMLFPSWLPKTLGKQIPREIYWRSWSKSQRECHQPSYICYTFLFASKSSF